jgi:TPP-dependent pyruvate/acetoin dehydrogenase alpha subunit
MTEEEDADLRAQTKRDIEAAVREAEQAPDPPPDDALRHVFAEGA